MLSIPASMLLKLALLSFVIGVGLATGPDEPVTHEMRKQLAESLHQVGDKIKPDELSAWARFRKLCCEGTGVYSEGVITDVIGTIGQASDSAQRGAKQTADTIQEKFREGAETFKDHASSLYHQAKDRYDDLTGSAKASVREGEKQFAEFGGRLQDSAKQHVDDVSSMYHDAKAKAEGVAKSSVQGVKESASDVAGGIQRKVRQAGDQVSDLYQGVKDNAGRAKESLQDRVGQTKESLQDKVGQTKECLQGKVGQTKESLQDKVGQTKESLQDKVGQTKECLQDKVEQTKETVGSTMHGAAKKTAESTSAAYQEGKDRVGDLAKSAHESLPSANGAGSQALDRAKEMFENLIGRTTGSGQDAAPHPDMTQSDKESVHDRVEDIQEAARGINKHVH